MMLTIVMLNFERMYLSVLYKYQYEQICIQIFPKDLYGIILYSISYV